MPKLNVAGLGLTGLTLDKIDQQKNAPVANQESNIQNQGNDLV